MKRGGTLLCQQSGIRAGAEVAYVAVVMQRIRIWETTARCPACDGQQFDAAAPADPHAPLVCAQCHASIPARMHVLRRGMERSRILRDRAVIRTRRREQVLALARHVESARHRVALRLAAATIRDARLPQGDHRPAQVAPADAQPIETRAPGPLAQRPEQGRLDLCGVEANHAGAGGGLLP